MINEQLLTLCRHVRYDAIPLVDAFNYPDWFLRAPVGTYDGNIYPKYFEVVSGAPLGKTSYWAKEIAPLTTAKL